MQEDTCAAQKLATASPAGRPSVTTPHRSTQSNGEVVQPASQKESARRRGELAKEYEARNSAVHKIWRQNLDSGRQPPQTPRPARKPGLRTFTNPMNPFERNSGINIPSMDEMRQDADRAGARTKNPGIVAGDRSPTGERRTSPHFYSAPADWRRQKRGVAPPSSGRSSVMSIMLGCDPDSPVTESTGSKQPPILHIYLNDMHMERIGGAKRTGPSTPSAEYQRMMDRRVHLPAEREVVERLPRSARPFGADCDYGSPRGSPRPTRLTRSVSCEPWLREPTRGFQRRRQVSGSWTRSTDAGVFHHTGEATVTPRRFERLERAASAQFDAAVEHMRSTLPAQRNLFNECRAQGKEGSMNSCLAPTSSSAVNNAE